MEPVRAWVLEFARNKYVGFDDSHPADELREEQGIELGRETVRRILRAGGPR